jgi:hypothetical protein
VAASGTRSGTHARTSCTPHVRVSTEHPSLNPAAPQGVADCGRLRHAQRDAYTHLVHPSRAGVHRIPLLESRQATRWRIERRSQDATRRLVLVLLMPGLEIRLVLWRESAQKHIRRPPLAELEHGDPAFNSDQFGVPAFQSDDTLRAAPSLRHLFDTDRHQHTLPGLHDRIMTGRKKNRIVSGAG